jgi:hypothetical protein
VTWKQNTSVMCDHRRMSSKNASLIYWLLRNTTQRHDSRKCVYDIWMRCVCAKDKLSETRPIKHMSQGEEFMDPKKTLNPANLQLKSGTLSPLSRRPSLSSDSHRPLHLVSRTLSPHPLHSPLPSRLQRHRPHLRRLRWWQRRRLRWRQRRRWQQSQYTYII